MNLIDLVILAILAIGFVSGWFKGFLVSVLNLASYAVAFVVALIGYPAVAGAILSRSNFDTTLLYLTAGVEKLSDMSVAGVSVDALSPERISEIITTSDLPEPIERMMLHNITERVFAGQNITTMSDYFNQTIINLSMSLISFLILFFAVRLVCMFVIGLTDYAVHLPVLKQFDSLLGGAAGVLHAAVIVAVLFAITPIAMSVLPLPTLNEMIRSSLLGRLFFNTNFIFGVLRSVF